MNLDDLKYLRKIMCIHNMEYIEILNEDGVNIFNETQFYNVLESHRNISLYPIQINSLKHYYARIDKSIYSDTCKITNFIDLLKIVLPYLEISRNDRSISLLDDFLVELLSRRQPYLEMDFVNNANLVKFDVEVPRVLVLIDVKYFKQRVRSQIASNHNLIQMKLNQIHSIIKQAVHYPHEYAIYLYDDKFVFFSNSTHDIKVFLDQLLVEIMDKTDLEVQFIISRECRDYQSYYDEFQQMLLVQEQIGRKCLDQTYIYLDDNLLEILMLNVNKKARHYFLEGYQTKIEEILEKKPELVETFQMFFKKNLDINETAQSLYLHRNTIYYRINQLSEWFERNLFNSYESTQLFLAISIVLICPSE